MTPPRVARCANYEAPDSFFPVSAKYSVTLGCIGNTDEIEGGELSEWIGDDAQRNH
jgi:hypothetical protein